VGSTFAAVLSCTYRGRREVTSVPEVSAQPDPARLPVLVVDDNRETLFIYEKFLKGSPFQVIPARTVREARRDIPVLMHTSYQSSSSARAMLGCSPGRAGYGRVPL
jgi:hypothetical protein